MARAPRLGEFGRRQRKTQERVRRQETKDLPQSPGGGSSFLGAMFWRSTNQDITGTTSGQGTIEWNRSAGDASIVIDGGNAARILIPAPGWWRATFNGRADMNAGGLSTGQVRASIGWRDYENDDHWVGQLCPVVSTFEADWSVTTPPVYVSMVTGDDVVMPPFFHAQLGFAGMTNPGTLRGMGQDDSSLDVEGYPVNVDVMRFSVERL